jgi:hypothetical protein
MTCFFCTEIIKICRISDDVHVFSTQKAPEFEKAKADGSLVANMGRAPLLDVGNMQVGQSHTINRYIATKHGYMGKNPVSCPSPNNKISKKKKKCLFCSTSVTAVLHLTTWTWYDRPV